MTEVGERTIAQRTRGQRTSRTGTVVAKSGDKTIRVRYQFSVKHPKYGKYIRRFTTLHAHDADNQAGQGDKVEVVACRRLSKTKFWRLIRVIKGA